MPSFVSHGAAAAMLPACQTQLLHIARGQAVKELEVIDEGDEEGPCMLLKLCTWTLLGPFWAGFCAIMR
jgi:hypothetical protein